MGDQLMKKPEGDVRYPSRYGNDAAGLEPGKATLVPPTAAPTTKFQTGNSFADKGLACEGEQAGSCFLDAGARARLSAMYRERVNAALIAYMSALTKAGVEELLKTEDNSADWMVDILLDVIGSLTSKSAVAAFKSLTAKGAETIILEGVGVMVTPEQIAGPGLAHFTEITGTAIGKGKAYAAPKLKGLNVEAGSQKAHKVSYIAMLQKEANVRYQRMREDALAGADDAKLVVMFEAMAAENGHDMPSYEAAIAEKLDRFMKTKIKDIGLSTNDKGMGGKKGEVRPVGAELLSPQEETHAFWVDTAAGRRLALYRTPYLEEGPASVLPKTEYQKTAHRMNQIAQQQLEFVELVPKDFESAAAQIHAQKWGYEPVVRAAGPHEQMQAIAADAKERAEEQAP